jgi:hypothetical protein
MLNTFTGPADLRDFWEAVTAQRGRIVSPGAASVVLRCSFEQIYRIIEDGELEAWVYCPAEGRPALHYMVSIPSLVRYGIRTGHFHSAQDRDLGGLNVTEAEFLRLQAEALRDGA